MKYLKDDIICDALKSIEQNPRSDLIYMMEQFLLEKDEFLLEEIKNLLNGKSYQNPCFHFFETEDVNILDNILENYILSISTNPCKVFNETLCLINELNERCNCYLIDEFRAEMLEDFLIYYAKQENLVCVYEILELKKMW